MTEPVISAPARFRGPNSGIVATVFVLLFFAGLVLSQRSAECRISPDQRRV